MKTEGQTSLASDAHQGQVAEQNLTRREWGRTSPLAEMLLSNDRIAHCYVQNPAWNITLTPKQTERNRKLMNNTP